MKYIISILIIALAFMSCEKDSVVTSSSTPVATNQSVSGTAFFDLSGDGIGEEPMRSEFVFLGDSLTLSTTLNDSLLIINPEVLWTRVDSEGNYIFEGVAPAENQVLMILPDSRFSNLVGVDNIEDGDINETLRNELIQISIEEDETDDGNDFVAYKPLPAIIVSGYVLEDVDGDLIGDVPVAGHRLLLALRNDNGEPVGMGGSVSITDENGFFQYSGIPTDGEYVINYVGTDEYDYTCVSNMDQSQEVGEPDANVECYLIPVNLNSTVTEDHDNVFVIKKATDISISGFVLEDNNGDLQADQPTPNQEIGLFERSANGLPLAQIDARKTDENGAFNFFNIPNGEYVLELLNNYHCASSIDQSQEPGEPDANIDCIYIPVNLTDTNTEDLDNVFVLDNAGIISGFVLEDIDGDSIGDIPVFDHIILLSERSVGQTIITSRSDKNGFFEFTEISRKEYFIQNVGSGDFPFTHISRMDQSQEPGEPDPYLHESFIPVNLTNGILEDHDNVYVIKRD